MLILMPKEEAQKIISARYAHSLIEDKLIKLRQENPCLTLQALGDIIHRSRERVRQLLAKNNVATKRISLPKYQCQQCHRKIAKDNKSGFCRQCKHPNTYMDIPCFHCGKIVHRQIAAIKNNLTRGGHGNVFCDKSCFGKYIAAKTGFTVYPEHMNFRIKAANKAANYIN